MSQYIHILHCIWKLTIFLLNWKTLSNLSYVCSSMYWIYCIISLKQILSGHIDEETNVTIRAHRNSTTIIRWFILSEFAIFYFVTFSFKLKVQMTQWNLFHYLQIKWREFEKKLISVEKTVVILYHAFWTYLQRLLDLFLNKKISYIDDLKNEEIYFTDCDHMRWMEAAPLLLCKFSCVSFELYNFVSMNN